MIRFDGVWKSYGGRPALRGVTAHIGAGERVALVGPNGSGKTTLLRCLLGLLSYEGRIDLCGHDPRRGGAGRACRSAPRPQG